jgi:hypothetical protein
MTGDMFETRDAAEMVNPDLPHVPAGYASFIAADCSALHCKPRMHLCWTPSGSHDAVLVVELGQPWSTCAAGTKLPSQSHVNDHRHAKEATNTKTHSRVKQQASQTAAWHSERGG